MDYKLNKLSINENIPNGFIWVSRYSSTNDSDERGRWAVISELSIPLMKLKSIVRKCS